ncbi:hypothetical protein QUF76_11655 [Desulfobacterales bacterium HSG16]|nr:hypothetical protein [Desulfobacterales bacterium HSG16]
MKDHEVQSFLVSSKTPAKKTLSRYGYTLTSHDGIFESRQEFSDLITVVSLNDLADARHNAFAGLFGSKKKAKLRALDRLGAMTPDMMAHLPEKLMRFIGRIAEFLMRKGDNNMEKLTSEEKKTVANILDHWIVPNLPLGELLSRYSDDEVLSRYSQEKVLSRYSQEEVLSRYSQEEVLSRYSQEEVLSRYDANDRLKGLKPEDIEAYLKSLKKNQ